MSYAYTCLMLVKLKNASGIDQLDIVGLCMTILFSPCCFPPAAVLFSFLGMNTSFELFGSWTFYILQAMVLLAVLVILFLV